MIWRDGIVVTIGETSFHLDLSVSMYGSDWIVTVRNSNEVKLLPEIIYLHFDGSKNYLSHMPVKGIPDEVCKAIVDEIKKHDSNWIRGIYPD